MVDPAFYDPGVWSAFYDPYPGQEWWSQNVGSFSDSQYPQFTEQQLQWFRDTGQNPLDYMKFSNEPDPIPPLTVDPTKPIINAINQLIPPSKILTSALPDDLVEAPIPWGQSGDTGGYDYSLPNEDVIPIKDAFQEPETPGDNVTSGENFVLPGETAGSVTLPGATPEAPYNTISPTPATIPPTSNSYFNYTPTSPTTDVNTISDYTPISSTPAAIPDTNNQYSDLVTQMITNSMQQSQPLMDLLYQNATNVMSGDYDPSQSPMYAAAKQAAESQYGTAAQEILNALPKGGGLQTALAQNLSNKAGTLTGALSDIYQTEAGRAYDLANATYGPNLTAATALAQMQTQKDLAYQEDVLQRDLAAGRISYEEWQTKMEDLRERSISGAEIQTEKDLAYQKDALARELAAGEISYKEYADKQNALLQRWLAKQTSATQQQLQSQELDTQRDIAEDRMWMDIIDSISDWDWGDIWD